MAECWATVPDWSEKQHYKDDRGPPPWIKLHVNILNSRRFQMMHLASKALAPCIWLLAAKNSGRVNIEIEELVFQLRWPREEIEIGLNGLIDNGYLVCSSNALATLYQGSTPETETYREETETEADKSALRAPRAQDALVLVQEDVSRETPQKPKRTPRDALLRVLDADRAEALLAHRKALRAPLTAHAADLLAGKLALARDGPNAAADLMIERGWKGFNPEWEQSHDRKTSTDRTLEAIAQGVLASRQ